LTIALYPGTFDPITKGHIDIVKRASSLFDRLTIGIYDRPEKRLLFTTEERIAMAMKAVEEFTNVDVRPYSNLTIEFAREIGAHVLVRGLRMSSDFEKEFEMAMMNKKLAPDLELVCLMTSLRYQFLSSSLLKEVAGLSGAFDDLVPDHVAAALRKKFAHVKEMLGKKV
jgi:pantetheine-phosphate adenylyltransferase